MEIVVLIKPLPDPETRLRPNSAGTDFDTEAVKFVLSGYDESAVEQALLLKESIPSSKVRAISFGPAPRTEEVLRQAIALGVDHAVWVEQPPGVVADSILAARALAAVIRRQSTDLILCGRQASDDEQGLVAGAIGALLQIPAFGGVADLRWNPSAGRFIWYHSAEHGRDTWDCAPPLCVGLHQAWNDPRTAKLPNILKSRKASIERIPWSELAGTSAPSSPSTTVPTSFRLPPPRTGAKMIDFKTPDEAAQKLVKLLREEAKVLP